jgi:hypothetical protein
VRLSDDLARWLETTAKEMGVSQGKIIRDLLEKLRTAGERPFMRLAGQVSKAPDLSMRRGFSKT